MTGGRRSTLAATAVAVLALAACGGTGDAAKHRVHKAAVDTSTTAASGRGTTSAVGGSSTTAKGSASDGLAAVGGSVRLADFYVGRDHRPVDVDAYWGSDARADRRIATVGYGTVSGAVAARGTGASGPDGSPPEVAVSFFVAGHTDPADRIATAGSPYDKGFRWLVEVSWGRSFGAATSGLQPASTQIVEEQKIGKPVDGSAAVIVNNLGALGVGDGNPLDLSPLGACGSWHSDSGSFDDGGAGESSYQVAPGAVQIVGYDNRCMPATAATNLTVATGDRVLVFAYGADAASRRLVAVPVAAA